MVGEVIVLLDFVVCTILHVMNWKDFADTILVIAIVCVLAILLMGTTILLDICKRRLKNYRMEAIGVLGASLAAVIQIIVYFQKEVQFSGTILAIGLMFLLITAVIKNLRNVVIMENEKREAILTSEAKARFLANMSHEIRTPINAVLGMDAMILRESKELPIKEYAMDIQNAGQKLLTLVNEILDLSKVESGKMEIISEEYDFGSMIHDITNMVTGKAQDKNLELNVFVEQSLPSRLLGDEVRIRQILINILNNAVKYTNEGSVRLRVSGELLDNRVLLNFAVEDTGVGIKEEDLPKLFAEFERIEEQKNRGVEGTGLGMSITSKLLRLMGSELQVRSVYGQGSVFSFELEQQIVDTTPIGNLEDRIRQQIMEYQYNVGFVAPEAKLLVVDDNRMNLKVFVNLLKDTQVQIDTADSGAECLTLVKEKRYDIIFLDHMMPEMDGIATLHCMKQLEDYPSKDAPIIALTANAISRAKEMYLAEGFDGFLSKPIIPERLEEMIQKLLPEGLVSYETKVKPPEDLKSNIGEEKPGLEQTEAVAGNKQEEADKIELLDIDGIDWSYGQLHLPDKKILLMTVQDFYRTIDTDADDLEMRYNQLQLSLESQTTEVADKELNVIFQAYRIRVHAMKSSAALIGAVPLAGMAKVLEYAARDKKWEIVKDMTPIFLTEWRGYKEKLQICMPKQEKREIQDITLLLELLEGLRIAMEELDIDGMDAAIEQLQQYQYLPEVEMMMEQLSIAVTNLDSEQALPIIEKMSIILSEYVTVQS